MPTKEPQTMTTLDMAERIAEGNQSVEKIAAQIRNLAQRNLIHNFGHVKGSGRTAHRLFSDSMMAQAKVLITLVEMGFADKHTTTVASIACFTHFGEALNRDKFPFDGPTPMQFAIEQFRLGIGSRLEIHYCNSPHGEWSVQGQILIDGKFFDHSKLITIADIQSGNTIGYVTKAFVTIPLTSMFAHLFSAETVD